MKFWAIAYRYQEDVFYDLGKMDDHLRLEHTCLLPTKELAERIIEEELSVDYVPVEIEFDRLDQHGNWSYSCGRVENWDD